jgi:hypothetical protein
MLIKLVRFVLVHKISLNQDRYPTVSALQATTVTLRQHSTVSSVLRRDAQPAQEVLSVTLARARHLHALALYALALLSITTTGLMRSAKVSCFCVFIQKISSLIKTQYWLRDPLTM